MQSGTVVIATAGKEKGGFYAVVQVLDSRTVLIADGRRRPIEKPKKKNIAHLKRTNHIIGTIGSNRQLRMTLKSLEQGLAPAASTPVDSTVTGG